MLNFKVAGFARIQFDSEKTELWRVRLHVSILIFIFDRPLGRGSVLKNYQRSVILETLNLASGFGEVLAKMVGSANKTSRLPRFAICPE